jgi:hypothetical protein
MANEKTGRNDPCPCGSGKKYKRCCLAKDAQLPATPRVPAAKAASVAPAPRPKLDPQRLPELLREFARSAPKGERGEIEQLLAETGPLLAYVERQPEIEAASRALDAHRADFDQLCDDQSAFMERARALFAEERFVPLRFTAADVRRAFGQVGQPPAMAASDRYVEKLVAAILHLADEERRDQLVMSLLLHLPDYVAAGRPLDACIIQHCAWLTGDVPDESNPFLFEMFSYGYDAWAAEQRTRGEAALREVGIDPARLPDMSVEDIDAWLDQQQANPALQARLEAVLQAHPDQKAQAIANLEEMERDCITLLQREDAADLLLSPEELAAWLPRLNECLESVRDHWPDSTDAPPTPADQDALAQALFPVIGEMAAAIFTAERRQELVARLKAHRKKWFAADKRAASQSQIAINSLELEGDPAQNRFLNVLCFTSLSRFSKTMAEDEPPE